MLRYVVCLARLNLIVMDEDYKLVITLLRDVLKPPPEATTFNATPLHTSECIPRRERSSIPPYGRHYRDAIHVTGRTG